MLNHFFKAIAILMIPASIAIAELKENPDANTLWSIDNGNQAGWYDNSLSKGVRENPQGGFLIGDDNPINRGHVIRHRVPLNQNYPWLVFEVTSAETFNKQKYQRWGLSIQKMNNGIGSVTNVEPGLYAVNCFENAPEIKPDQKTGILRAYFFDVEFGFKTIRMMKEPENYVEATSPAFTSKKCYAPGDELTFSVHLKDPAEEVALKIVDLNYLYTVRLNNKDMIELTPQDDTGRLWSAKVKIESLTCGGRQLGSMMLLRATVLGGKIQKPVWGVINYPFKKDTK